MAGQTESARRKKPLWPERANAVRAWREERPDKRVALLDLRVERSWRKRKRTLRLIVRLTNRTQTSGGQQLLLLKYMLESWWTSLAETPQQVIALYRDPTTHEQFHGVIKTDLDLERLPSGKFDCNDAIPHLAMFAYNSLRLIGQWDLTRRTRSDPPSRSAPPPENRAAGTDLLRRSIHPQSPPPDSGLRPYLPSFRRLRPDPAPPANRRVVPMNQDAPNAGILLKPFGHAGL